VKEAIAGAQSAAELTLNEAEDAWNAQLQDLMKEKEEESMRAILAIQEAAHDLTEENGRALEVQMMRSEEMRTRLIEAHDLELAKQLNRFKEAAEREKLSALHNLGNEWEQRSR